MFPLTAFKSCSVCFGKHFKPEWHCDLGYFFPQFWDLSSVMFVWAVWVCQPSYLSWHWPCPWLWEPFVMQVHQIKRVFVIPKLAPSQWLAACLCVIPQRGENSMTWATVVCLTERECTGHLSYVALICSSVRLISRQDGQADGVCYSSTIPLSVMQQHLMLCWR